MHTARPAQPGDIGAIVDDDEGIPRPRELNDGLGERKEGAARSALVAKLQDPGASREAGPGEAQRIEPPRAAQAGIDDGIKKG